MAWHIRGNRILSDREAASEDSDSASAGLKGIGILALVALAFYASSYFKLGDKATGFLVLVGVVVGYVFGEAIGAVLVVSGIVGFIGWVVYLLFC